MSGIWDVLTVALIGCVSSLVLTALALVAARRFRVLDHPEAAASSRRSILSPHRSLIAIHNRTYSQRNSGFGGNHLAGSLAPFDRFAEADTAIKVFGSDRSLAY